MERFLPSMEQTHYYQWPGHDQVNLHALFQRYTVIMNAGSQSELWVTVSLYNCWQQHNFSVLFSINLNDQQPSLQFYILLYNIWWTLIPICHVRKEHIM